MARITVKIEGFDEIQRKWREAPQVVKKELQSAIKKTVIVMESKVKSEAPVDTGNLANRIQRRITPMRGVIFTTVKYAPYVEYGTRPHVIRPKAGKVLAFQKQSGSSVGTRKALYRNRKTGRMVLRKSKNTTILARVVNHPGTKANPFFQRSAEEYGDKVTKIFYNAVENVGKHLEKK